MFKIYDGRDCFYQWDIDRQLIIEDATIKEVHFECRGVEQALVMKAYKQNGKWMVDVPNTLLQFPYTISAYGYDINYTKYE